jgi:hypothetical protein
MNSVRYIGMDVHRETISVAVLDESGRLMMQSVLATRASAVLDFIHGVRGQLQVTFEEGTHSGWLYDVLVRRVEKVVVCDPRKNALLKSGSKSDAEEMCFFLDIPFYRTHFIANGRVAQALGCQSHHYCGCPAPAFVAGAGTMVCTMRSSSKSKPVPQAASCPPFAKCAKSGAPIFIVRVRN